MYVCLCRNVTDTHIREAVAKNGTQTLRQLSQATGACTGCGKCAEYAKLVLEQCIGCPVISAH